MPRISTSALLVLQDFNNFVTDSMFNAFFDWYLKKDISYLSYHRYLLLLMLYPWGHLILVHKLFFPVIDADNPKPVLIQKFQFLNNFFIHNSIGITGIYWHMVDRIDVYLAFVKIRLLWWYSSNVRTNRKNITVLLQMRQRLRWFLWNYIVLEVVLEYLFNLSYISRYVL